MPQYPGSPYDLHFKVGDPIQVISTTSRYFGKLGTILRLDPGATWFRYLVEFDVADPIDLFQHVSDKSTYFFSESEIKKIQVIEPVPSLLDNYANDEIYQTFNLTSLIDDIHDKT